VPTYEYRCPDGHEFEQFVQKISLASAELPCPVCGKLAARRMSAGGGFVFKGSGFYITDYGKDGKKDQRDKVEKAATSQSEAATSTGEGAKTDAPGKADEPAANAGKGGTSERGEKSAKAAKDEKRSEGAKTEKSDRREKKAPAVPAPPASPKHEGGKD
jgi:putative FmdB family regulatory protein